MAEATDVPPLRGVQALERLCAIAAAICGAEASALLLSQGGVSRVVASHGFKARLRSFAWSFDEAPYEPDQQFLLEDARTSDYVQSHLPELGMADAGFFLRIPLAIAAEYSAALVIAGKEPGKAPGPAKRALLDETVALIRAEFQGLAPLLTDPAAHVNLARTLDDVKVMIARLPEGAALLDQNLELLAVNPPLARLLGQTPEAMVGRAISAIDIPTGDTLRLMLAKALESGLSPPDFEIVTGSDGTAQRTFRLRVAPFSPIDTRDDFVCITVEEVTDLAGREDRLAVAVYGEQLPPAPDPTTAFLLDTLVMRRTVRTRKGVSYLTLRSWRQPVRSYQISALKALKQNIPQVLPEQIATEMAGEIGSFIGAAAFSAIVPMPCGHSAPGQCLALAVARALGRQLGLPVVEALRQAPRKGVSHPKENLKRPPMLLAGKPTGPVLLIDDVATSGAHVEEAARLLKGAGAAVMPVVWIGGDASD